MAGEGGSGGFLAGVAGVTASIASFLKGFFAITARELVRLITYLKNALVTVTQALLDGTWRLARALARHLVSFVRFVGHGFKQFALLAWRKLLALEGYLKKLFAPVLRYIKILKEHIEEFYKKFIRPILDTIEFIRQVNRVLQIFHIDVLKKLDVTLAQIEARIEAPFLWARQHITELENWINRIVTADGLFQRLTLLRSLDGYAPEWIGAFWRRQATGLSPIVAAEMRGLEHPLQDAGSYGTELGKYYRRRESEIGGLADELAAVWLEAARGANA